MSKKYYLIIIVILVISVLIWFFVARRNNSQNAPTQTSAYTNPYFFVQLQYPATWQPDFNFVKVQGIPTHFTGPDGFFAVDTIGGKDAPLTEVVQTLISTANAPFGQTPGIQEAELGDQEATFIYPSADQASDQRNGSAFIVRYPKPISFDKKTNYYYLVLFADKDHIVSIAQTMVFMSTQGQ